MDSTAASVVGLPDFDEARSATAIIKGYLFQFDATISELLNSTNNVPVRVEGVEDFDVASADWTRCVQCKYYEATELTTPVLRNVIVPMLRRLKEAPETDRPKWRFSLYGHFKNSPAAEKTEPTPRRLSECLKTHKILKDKSRIEIDIALEEGFDNSLLEAFSKQFEIHSVLSFEKHREQVVGQLQSALLTSRSATLEIHYPAALAYVANLATNKVPEERISTRLALLNVASPSSNTLNGLLLRAFGDERYCAVMRKRYFSALNREPVHHTFAIQHQYGSNHEDLINAVRTIATKYGSQTARRKPQSERRAPIVLLADMPDEVVKTVKSGLLRSNCLFNDGFMYQGASFDPIASLGVSTSLGTSQLALLDRPEQLQSICALNRPMTHIHHFSRLVGAPIPVNAAVVEVPVGSFNWIPKIV